MVCYPIFKLVEFSWKPDLRVRRQEGKREVAAVMNDHRGAGKEKGK